MLGLEQQAFCGLGWEKRAGSQGKGSGCGELKEELAQLDFEKFQQQQPRWRR